MAEQYEEYRVRYREPDGRVICSDPTRSPKDAVAIYRGVRDNENAAGEVAIENRTVSVSDWEVVERTTVPGRP